MINPMDLTGKRVLVAGASSATGEAITGRLCALGAVVIMLDSDEAKLTEITKRISCAELHQYSFNIYDNSSIEPQMNLLKKTYGPFDGFVYSGGIGGVRPLSLTNNSFTHEMMNANLYTFIELVRCMLKKNGFNAGGSIVAVSSVSSIKGLKSKTAYAASKAALDAAVRSMAAELSDKGIRVNSILKGWVTADMKQDFIKNNMELSDNDDFRKQIMGVIEPVEIANTVAFLLSDATKSITGSALLLDGGYTL